MLVQFEGARLKIDRANVHIAEIEAILGALPKNYTARIDRDEEAGSQAIVYTCNIDLFDLKSNLSLLVGDAIHNLRTALDYSWVAVLQKCAPSIITKWSRFLIADLPSELEKSLRGAKI